MDESEIKSLVKKAGNLHYDVTAQIIQDIASAMNEDSKEISDKNYILAQNSAAQSIYSAKNSLDKAWLICKKYDKTEECAKHPRELEGYNTKTIGSEIHKNNFTKLFICELADDLWSQGYGDLTKRDRKKLAGYLYTASEKLNEANDFLYIANNCKNLKI
jgi:hypothetical protein